MADIKSMQATQAKWQSRASVSQADYEEGVRNPRANWAENTAKANDSWKSGVSAAAAADRFATGVRKAGNTKWQQMAIAKGPSRWAQGISVSGDAYARGFAPYHQILSNLTLPPRGPRGDIKNYERSKAVGVALNKARLSKAT